MLFGCGFWVCTCPPTTSFTLRAILNPHHGVKQCFHTMDVTAYHWTTLHMGFAGPTSEKAAKHMKNRVIFVAKRCENFAQICEARDQR